MLHGQHCTWLLAQCSNDTARGHFHRDTGDFYVDVLPSKPFSCCRTGAYLGRTLHAQQLAAGRSTYERSQHKQDASTAATVSMAMHGAGAGLPANTPLCGMSYVHRMQLSTCGAVLADKVLVHS